MKTLTTRKGATLPLTIKVDDITATMVEIFIKATVSGSVIFSKSAPFTDGEADLTMTDAETDTIPVADYIYQINVTYPDKVEIYPDTTDCEEECGFPDFIVCASLGS